MLRCLMWRLRVPLLRRYGTALKRNLTPLCTTFSSRGTSLAEFSLYQVGVLVFWNKSSSACMKLEFPKWLGLHLFLCSWHSKKCVDLIMLFFAGALETLQELSKCCDLVVVTSRQHVIQGCTMKWLDEHFPGVFSDVYFGNHWAMEGPSKRKSDICRSASFSCFTTMTDTKGFCCPCAGSFHFTLHIRSAVILAFRASWGNHEI